jgi:predicted porin
MKKSLLALAVLSGFATLASAQSSVTLSGMLDAGVRYINEDYSLGGSQSGYNNFTITVREDLGGGLTAFGVLNHRFNIANGGTNTKGNGADVFWRNAFVGLGSSSLGDIRLGRMLMPLQDMNGGFDAFATGYVGGVHTGGINATVRANQTIYYRSPSLGGFKLEAAIAAAEGQYREEITDSGRKYYPGLNLNDERPVGGSIRYAAGPINVGVAYDVNTTDQETLGIYGSYDFGMFKLFGQYETSDDVFTTVAAVTKESIDTYSISATVPFGAFVLKGGFALIDSDLSGRDGNKWGLGADYFLSKRTNLYSTVGALGKNRFKGPKEDSVRFDVGVTHRF